MMHPGLGLAEGIAEKVPSVAVRDAGALQKENSQGPRRQVGPALALAQRGFPYSPPRVQLNESGHSLRIPPLSAVESTRSNAVAAVRKERGNPSTPWPSSGY